MVITIIGHGYVGIVAACVFADFGNKVFVIGRTPEKLARLRRGDPLIYEPGLAELLEKNIKADRLVFTTEYAQALHESSIVFNCVGTPPKPETGEADLSAVFHVTRQIGRNLDVHKFTVVSCKSTVPVGTNHEVEKIIREELTTRLPKGKTCEDVFAVASCPEFLREGSGIYDTLNPDRTVIGTHDKRAAELLLELHKPLPGERILCDISSAELIKYASNSLLATKISFANMISFFAEKLGADAPKVLRAVGLDNRIGPKNLDVSIGYGGACFPKDVQALTATGKAIGVDVSLLEAVERVNHIAWQNFTQKVLQHVTPGSRIAVWGLSFKANTDDVRFAPSLKIIKALSEKGYSIAAYDPAAMQNARRQVEDAITFYVDDPYEALEGSSALCVLTEWNEFRQADMQKVRSLLKVPLIIDGRNLYDPDTMKNLGITYISTGR
jgi:UDPglucose 6-dehydrogenase